MADTFNTQVTSSLSAFNVDDLDPNTEYEIQVRAVSSDGVASEWTDPAYFVTPDDVAPPSVPTAPLVVSKLGTFSIKWDGRTETLGTMEPDFDFIKVFASGVQIGTIVTPLDEVVWGQAAYGLDYSFTLVAVDTSGNESDPSTGTTGRVTPLVSADIIGKIINGATMVVDGSIGAQAIAANAITADKIQANAITADKISAGAIDGMTITGTTIKAGALYTGTRTAYNDSNYGWLLRSDGYANVKDSTGSTFMEVHPTSQFFKVGNNSNRFLYDAAQGTLEIGTVNSAGFKVSASGAVTIKGALDVTGGLLTTGGRTAFNDGVTGWLIADNGYANVTDVDGKVILTVNPKDATRFVQVGETASDNYLRYTSNTGQLDIHASNVVLGRKSGASESTYFAIQQNATYPNGYFSFKSGSTDVGAEVGNRVNISKDGIQFYKNGVTPPRVTIGASNDTFGGDKGYLDTGGGNVFTKGIAMSSGTLLSRFVMGFTTELDVGAGNPGPLDQENPAGMTEGSFVPEPQAGFHFVGGSNYHVKSYGIWETTTSSAPNMFVGTNGWLYQGGVSARRFKVDIQEADFGDAILSLTPSTWHDRGASEKYAAALDAVDGDYTKIDDKTLEGILPLNRVPGLIAEDVHNAGLTDFVNYAEDGEIQSLSYDRLWVPLIPIVKKQRDQIADLTSRLAALEGKSA